MKHVLKSMLFLDDLQNGHVACFLNSDK